MSERTEHVKASIYTIQTCDGGGHKRKDRPNGGMYINKVQVSTVLTVAHPIEQFVIGYRDVQK